MPIWIGHSALNTNVFPTLFPRLQNVLEDFRDMDATALEETKATVRTRYVVLLSSSTGCVHNLKESLSC